MKKFLKIFIASIVIIGVSAAAYFFFLTPDEKFQSIYLVPKDAAFIIETENAFSAWNKIVHSDAWEHLKTNQMLSEINKSIEKTDSILSSKKILLKLFGSRKIQVSFHPYKPGKYEFLFVVDLKKTSKLKNIKNYLNKFLGDELLVTKREYNGYEIMELFNKETRDIYYFSFIKNQLLFSPVYVLLEASIDQLDKLTLGRDLNYIDVSRRTSGKGLFSICINYPYFRNYVTSIMGKPNEFISNLAEYLYYTSAYFTIDESGLFRVTGYTSLKDTSGSYFSVLVNSGKGENDVNKIAPGRTASVFKIGFNDSKNLFKNFNESLDNESRNNLESIIEKTEKKLKIDVEKNLLSWIDNEIALLQTKPSNLGRQNEFAVVFKAKNVKSARENLEILIRQIKKNSPVKFKEITYKGHTINYLHIPGVFKFLFGNLLDRLEKPYFTIVDKFVIFSNHPQTLKSIIDDCESENVLTKKEDFNTFMGNFPGKSSVFLYFQPPVLFNNMKEFVSPQVWVQMKRNKEYMVCFPNIGVNLESEKDLLRLDILAQFSNQVEEFKPVNYFIEPLSFMYEDTVTLLPAIPGEKEPEFKPEMEIEDLDASKHEEYYDNGNVKLSVGLKNGIKNGVYKEYYENGQLKVRGKYKNGKMEGNWKFYDENGEQTDVKEYKEEELIQ